MFSYDGHYTVWKGLEKAYRAGDYDGFAAIVQSKMPAYRESIDDLRLLFYIGLNFDERCFDIALPYFADWKENPPDRFQMRCEAYLYACENTVPQKLHVEKRYMHKFLALVGAATS
ncbi:MAG: hypothetical protein ACOYJ2_05445 [Rickettsiales bacterium]